MLAGDSKTSPAVKMLLHGGKAPAERRQPAHSPAVLLLLLLHAYSAGMQLPRCPAVLARLR
jgi:hypothetical protein